MSHSIRMCGVEPTYLDYLRGFDNKVSHDPKHNRKFIGILFHIDEHSYYAPLSSPKPRHNSISNKAPDVFKLKDGTLGIINLNNMIPIVEQAIVKVNIAQISDFHYQQLLKKQMVEIRVNEAIIKKKANRLYQIVSSGEQKQLTMRCCDFRLLERVSTNFGRVNSATEKETAAANLELE